MKRLSAALAGCFMLALASCAGTTATNVTTIASDASNVIADLVDAEQSIQSSSAVPASSLSDIQRAISTAQKDVALLGTSNSTMTVQIVLSDIDNAITLLGPWVPGITALLESVPSSTTAMRAGAPAVPVPSSLAADYARLKADAGVH